tara:strand:+ start:91 stop:579 length:489 start_codon:yes stop_codon:yes gene_type:complete
MAWAKLSSVTVGATPVDLIDSGVITSTNFIQTLAFGVPSVPPSNTYIDLSIRPNNNANQVYSFKRRTNSGEYSNTVNQSDIDSWANETQCFQVCYYANITGEEKLVMKWELAPETNNANYRPNRQHIIGKSADTTDITSIRLVNTYSGDYISGSNLSVIGTD